MALAMAKHGASVAILEINQKAGQETAHAIEKLGFRSLAITETLPTRRVPIPR